MHAHSHRDEEEDTASAQESTPSPPVQPSISNGNVLVDVPFRNTRITGLVDYEDEDEETPVGLGSNGKEGSFDRKVGSILPPLPISDQIWPEMEDVPVKRKVSPSLESEETLEAAAAKRRKPECEQAKDAVDMSVTGEAENFPSQSPTINDTTESSDISKLDEEVEILVEEDKENANMSIDHSGDEKRQSEGETPSGTPSGSEVDGSNGYESRRRGADCECGSEKESTQGDCKGSLEGSERVVVGAKENNTHPLSLGSDAKLASLGNEILRGGTQPSPGPYTVR
ncbi:hypothetical protein Mapa_014333 [Marchantia paleacea]|nr:hypothetical protein Mapa_014333 [Marchantia paleacea]